MIVRAGKGTGSVNWKSEVGEACGEQSTGEDRMGGKLTLASAA